MAESVQTPDIPTESAHKWNHSAFEVAGLIGLIVLVVLICRVISKCRNVANLKRKGYDFVKSSDSEYTTDTDHDNMTEIDLDDKSTKN
eukprot:CAMPEP_0197028146 /NCGR_PEP_ID=MMETSP1384-20130603/7906_1 /TAXON_ID=29189 /ORGANISM="Ammonia sp." /LENGTH=87 /DNA_ID=CAMNT_0042457099 /DNA_START=39 /DNA_END=302 /DNA_ORIENTATION=+